MAKKINAKNIVILETSATVLCTAFGLIGSYAFGRFYPYLTIDTGLIVAMSWLIPHGPLIFAATDSLRHEWGLKPPTSIIGQSLGGKRRKIPFKSNGQERDIFMFSIPWISKNSDEDTPRLDNFKVTIDDIDYTVSASEMESFVRTAWHRQRNGKPGLSRPYWTKQHRPRLKTLEYNARMDILLIAPGLILDRSQGRSGRLANSPLLTIEALGDLFTP